MLLQVTIKNKYNNNICIMNNFKYIKNISSQEADILLYNQIGFDVDANGNPVWGIDGEAFAHEMKYLEERTEKINVRINSIGGSVIDGYSIISSILNSKVIVDTHIDGLAASIAGVIAMMGQTIYMKSYGTLMLHNPSGGDNKEVLDLVKKTLVTIFKERRAFKEEDINEMMDSETWIDSDTAKLKGFVDFVVSSEEKINVSKGESSLYNMALIYNKVINKESNITKQQMEKVTNKLNLSKDASEEAIVSGIEAIENKSESLTDELVAEKAKVTELSNKVEAFENEKEEAKNLEIKNVLDGYEKDGKLEKENRESVEKLALVDLESVKNMLDKVTVKKVANKVFDVTKVKNKKGTEDRSEWSIKDWQKNDHKGLAEMKNSAPETYTELYNKTYKK